jgi:hypothetical protein
MRQLCASVLIAAISLPVIRADRMTPAGASREWPKPKTPDDRRGCERVREGTQLIAKRTNQSAQFRGPTRGAAADAVRPPADSALQPAGTIVAHPRTANPHNLKRD